MIRKIKPQRAQRAQRVTESCYFYLSPPLCHSASSVVFQKTLFRKYQKVSGVLVTATRDTKDPFSGTLPHLFARIITCEIHHADACSGVGMVFGRFPDRKHLHVPDQTPRSRQAHPGFYVKIYKCV